MSNVFVMLCIRRLDAGKYGSATTSAVPLLRKLLSWNRIPRGPLRLSRLVPARFSPSEPRPSRERPRGSACAHAVQVHSNHVKLVHSVTTPNRIAYIPYADIIAAVHVRESLRPVRPSSHQTFASRSARPMRYSRSSRSSAVSTSSAAWSHSPICM